MKLLRSVPRPPLALSLALAVLASLVLVMVNETGYGQSAASLDRIAEVTHTRSQLNRLFQLVLDAETGSRGYLLTGDARYLQPYDTAVADVGRAIDELRRLYVQPGPDRDTVDLLARNVQRKLAEMDLSVRMRKQGNEDAWKFVLMTDVGKAHMDAIREQSGRLIASATVHMQESEAHVRQALLWSRIGVASVTFIALMAFWLYLRQTTALQHAGEREQLALQRERDQLEDQVRERTARLARLATHLQQVREEERGHLARELHDELGALLTAAKLDVARLKSRLGTPTPEVLQRLEHLTETLNSGIALKRRIIEDLRPSSLSNLGLKASLEILAREFSERSGALVETQLEAVTLDESGQLTVYRLVQESLTNIGKYAQASQAQVHVRNLGHHVEVEVSDNGQGFDPRAMRTATHGLAGMRHRVEAMGGRFNVHSTPGRGTRITARLPLRAISTPEASAAAEPSYP